MRVRYNDHNLTQLPRSKMSIQLNNFQKIAKMANVSPLTVEMDAALWFGVMVADHLLTEEMDTMVEYYTTNHNELEDLEA